jgi:hypothetical protein
MGERKRRRGGREGENNKGRKEGKTKREEERRKGRKETLWAHDVLRNLVFSLSLSLSQSIN